MTEFLIALIIAVVVLAIALWAIEQLAPPDLGRVLRIVVVGLFLIWLVVRALPFLGVA